MSAEDGGVLVVEDDADLREAIVDSLRESGYRTMQAANGQDALMQLKRMERPPAVILLDIMMPVMDGVQFRTLQQEDPALAAIPVVVVTAVGDPQERATQMGAAAALRKPVHLTDLLRTVGRFCSAGSP